MHIQTPFLGDYLEPGEDHAEGLKQRLDERRLAPLPEFKQLNVSRGVYNEYCITH